MAHLSLGVLGPLRVLIDDAPVSMANSEKVCALFVYLAVEAGRPHRRESLVALLWPDCPEQAARHALRQALLSLRSVIGDYTADPPYLLISRDALQFNCASGFSLDLAKYNAISQAFEQSRTQGTEEPAILAARLEEMVQLCRGEFLQDFSLGNSAEFEEWALVRRENLHRRALDAHSWLAGYYERHGDFLAAQRHALRQLELDPWQEEAHRRMMRTLGLDGQRSAALAQFAACRRVLAEELGVEPSASTRELYEQIRTGNLKTDDVSRGGNKANSVCNLPVLLTPFLGRERELTDLDRLIGDSACRCISLVGPGGIGKTRLALQCAERHRVRFGDGVAFVPLAPVDSAGAPVAAIADAIRFFSFGPDDPRVQMLNHLRSKQMLLILDNVEHSLTDRPVNAGIVELMLEILECAPNVKLLATSREVLHLQEEWVFEVEGLSFPDTEQVERYDGYDAVALFIQRARRASPGFAIHETDLAEVAHICRLVEGMPLAIELAAPWVRLLSPAEIAQEIEGSLDVLSASLRDLPERHRSMRVVFDHSWRRLSLEEQQVLCQLSVFRGGFTRQAAEEVAGASLVVLSTLVNRTLLRRTACGRYQTHLLVRQYSASRLAENPQKHRAAQRRHYDYFLALAKAAEPELKGRNRVECLGQLEHEYSNFRRALEWAHERDSASPGNGELALRLSGALHRFWQIHGHVG